MLNPGYAMEFLNELTGGHGQSPLYSSEDIAFAKRASQLFVGGDLICHERLNPVPVKESTHTPPKSLRFHDLHNPFD